MKYFYDTEFIEGTQKKWFGKTKPTIDLISIGIVCEDGREYYAISKDFNLKEAWNRYDVKTEQVSGDMRNQFPNGIAKKVFWIRENVLKPIFIDLWIHDLGMNKKVIEEDNATGVIGNKMTYNNLKELIKKHGKSNKQIANEIKSFCNGYGDTFQPLAKNDKNIEFYGYYSDYDHVALCWLFGKMIELPKGFPMYTIDLKQELDRKIEKLSTKEITDIVFGEGYMKHDVFVHAENPKLDIKKIDCIKQSPKYPKQTNEHNALSDARFNYELYKFLESI